MVSVYCVKGAKGADGVKISRSRARRHDPAMAGDSVGVGPPGLRAELKVTVSWVLEATPVAPDDGVVDESRNVLPRPFDADPPPEWLEPPPDPPEPPPGVPVPELVVQEALAQLRPGRAEWETA
jgi:hypothetical protein